MQDNYSYQNPNLYQKVTPVYHDADSLQYANPNDERFVGLLGPVLLGGFAGGLAGSYLAGPRYYPPVYPPYPYGGYGAYPSPYYYRPY